MMVLREASRPWFLCALLFGTLVLLIPILGAPMIFLSGVAAAAIGIILVRPHAATFTAVFLLYSNVVVVLQRLLPYPQLLAACLVVPLVIQVAYYWLARREGLRVDSVFLLMLSFLVAQLLSSFAAQDFAIAAKHVLSFAAEGLLLYFLVINAVRSRTGLRTAVGAALLAAALLGGLSLYQAVTHSYDRQFGGLAQRDLGLDEDKPVLPGAAPKSGVRLSDRAAGPVGDPNRYAQILLVLLPLGAYRFWSERSPLRKMAILAACAMLMCGVLLSYSRGAFVTLALLVALLVAVGSLRLVHVATVVVLLAVAVPFVAPSYYLRIQTLVGAQGLVTKDPSVETDRVFKGRATEMLASLHVFLDHPFLGVGPGQYMPFYSQQYQLDPDVQLRQVATHRRGHDLYLEMAAETGLLGLTLFLSLPIVLLRKLWRARRSCAAAQPQLARLATAFCFAIIAYLGTGVFLHLAFERYYWFLLALSAAALYVIRQEQQDWVEARWRRTLE